MVHRPRPLQEADRPHDDSYSFSAALKPRFPYDRGHMCAKYTAFRMGRDADWNTHSLLNACPQRDTLNRGIWEDLERKVDAWADKFGAVWFICGPILNGRKPKKFLGEKGEVPVAIPDAFFKIVVKESATPKRPDVLAFVYPIPQSAHNHAKYLVSVDSIEARTGLDFLRKLPPSPRAGSREPEGNSDLEVGFRLRNQPRTSALVSATVTPPA